MKKLAILLFFTISITIVIAQNTEQIQIIQTKLETSEVINSIFSEVQKSEKIDIYSKELEKISIDQIIAVEQKRVLITILSENGLKKKQLDSFSQITELIKQLKESGNYEYPQVQKIFIFKNTKQDIVIVAIRDRAMDLGILEKFL